MSLSVVVLAAEVLEAVRDKRGTIKSLCYNTKNSQVNKKALYALVCECCRHYPALESVVRKCTEFERAEKSELFWMVLVYEFVRGKFRYDLNDKHIQLFWKHRNLLRDSFLVAVKRNAPFADGEHRLKYMRVNRLVDEDELPEDFELVDNVCELKKSPRAFMWDVHLKDLLVLSPGCNVSLLPGLKNGSLISQDKASCIPAFILSPEPGSQVIDCCAAPGNKTTQLASYVGTGGKVFAIEKEAGRFKVLQRMVSKAGADGIVECHNRDFLSLDPGLGKYANVEYALVDPSCSGSGMPLSLERYVSEHSNGGHDDTKDRVDQFAKFQAMVIKHAAKFPKVKKIVYSTCSVNEKENEMVVQEILDSVPGWALAHHPLPGWSRRGLSKYDFCHDVIRSDPQQDDMIGFFVALFIKQG